MLYKLGNFEFVEDGGVIIFMDCVEVIIEIFVFVGVDILVEVDIFVEDGEEERLVFLGIVFLELSWLILFCSLLIFFSNVFCFVNFW